MKLITIQNGSKIGLLFLAGLLNLIFFSNCQLTQTHSDDNGSDVQRDSLSRADSLKLLDSLNLDSFKKDSIKAFNQIRLELIQGPDWAPPASMEMIFQVHSKNPHSAYELNLDDFLVSENSALLNSMETKMTLTALPKLNYELRSLILIDVSRSLSDSVMQKGKESIRMLLAQKLPRQLFMLASFSESFVVWQDFTSDTSLLYDAFDRMYTSPYRYSSTNLNGAVLSALKLAKNSYLTDSTRVDLSVILYTDGEDNQGTTSVQTLVEERGTIPIYTILAPGSKASPQLLSLSNGGVYIPEGISDIVEKFLEVQKTFGNLTQSRYQLKFQSPARGDQIITLRLRHRDASEDDTLSVLTTRYNSSRFASGLPPRVDSVKLEGGDRPGQKICARYTYSDPDGEPEGKSIYTWYRNNSVIPGYDSLCYNLQKTDGGTRISFSVRPYSRFGSPAQGQLVYSSHEITVQVESKPVISGIRLGKPSVFAGDSVSLTYTYTDKNMDPEGQTIIHWLDSRDSLLLAGQSRFVADSAWLGKEIRLRLVPVALTGMALTGDTVQVPLGRVLGKFKDGNGKVFNFTKLGNKLWLAENLNGGSQINGRLNQTNDSLVEKYCIGDFPENCYEYGGLYQWTEALNLPAQCNDINCDSLIQQKHQGLCPAGWYIPSLAQWDSLRNFGGDKGGALSMKFLMRSDSGYISWKGNNESGFGLLPGGWRINNGGSSIFSSWSQTGQGTLIWTASSEDKEKSWAYTFNLTNLSYKPITADKKFYGAYLRCIKDWEGGL